jgi:hypothetical protein
MNGKLILLAMAAVLLIVGGCATTTPYNPFNVSQEEFYSKTRTIALATVRLPSGVADPDSVKANFESMITAKLQEGGFLVVPSREFADTWKQMNEQIGGYFDPLTGKRDETKLKTVREHTMQEISTKFNADAVLFPTIYVVSVKWQGGTVKWHGTSEPLMSADRQILETVFGVSRGGTVPALSLNAILEDIHGTRLYLMNGGIQLTAKLSGGQFTAVPVQDLLVNPERNQAAVNIALDPLTKKPGTQETSKEEKK